MADGSDTPIYDDMVRAYRRWLAERLDPPTLREFQLPDDLLSDEPLAETTHEWGSGFGKLFQAAPMVGVS